MFLVLSVVILVISVKRSSVQPWFVLIKDVREKQLWAFEHGQVIDVGNMWEESRPCSQMNVYHRLDTFSFSHLQEFSVAPVLLGRG